MARRVTAVMNRYAPLIKGCSVALIVLSLVLALRRLPAAAAVAALEEWIAGFGLWGVFVFVSLYVAAALLMLPGSVLTLAAGALFGLTLGTAAASLASTTAAALAFLLTRYLARDRLVRSLRRYPRFDALDRGIGEGGWKIVALLRLSPAVPFNLQNYLYGLTGIRFWPYVLTSWLAMLPGTFMYVYLGRAGVEAASGANARSSAQWGMMAVGLLATVGLTLYLTRLARGALRQYAVAEPPSTPAAQGWPWGATMLAVAALAALTAAGFLSVA